MPHAPAIGDDGGTYSRFARLVAWSDGVGALKHHRRICPGLTALVTTAALGCAGAARVPSPDPGHSILARLEDAPDQYYSIGDIRIRYREIGRGQPVVLLHGRANALEVWAWLADSLASDHRVIALDERGHGKSSKSADPTRYGHAMADDVLGLFNSLGIRQASLVGHSQGALLAAFVAMHMPDRVTKVALLAGPFFPDSATYAAENEVLVRDLETGHGFEGFLKARGVSDSAARARSAATMAHNDAASLAAVMKAQGSLMPDRTLAARIRAPALVVVGGSDELRDYNRALATWWPGAQFVEVPNATHMAILQRGETLSALRAYLGSAPTTRPTPPTRDPHFPGFVTAKELPDGTVPPSDADGNFIIGPAHTPAIEMLAHEGVPRGAVHTFTMSSADSKIFPGIARDSGTFGTPSPTDPATLVVTTSHPAPYTRTIAVYVPAQYVPGTIAPLIVGADGPDQSLFTALDNLIAEKRVPVMIAISIGNGGGDAQGSERGLEYDTMSGRYAEFVETEVLPLVERQYNVKLTRDPEGRATMGGSSGGSAAFIMAWYHPELYHRVLAYSITAINQQWPRSDETPHGAWEFHERLIPNSPVKPIRVWLEAGDRDFLNPNVMRDDMHDWVVASENMAKVLAAKGYHYQFVFARNAAHVDRAVKQQTLPHALEWLWKGFNYN